MNRSRLRINAVIISCAAVTLIGSAAAQAQVSVPHLSAMATRQLKASRVPYAGRIVVDAVRSQGFAAVNYGAGNRNVVIYVHPTPMQQYDLNTWAFVIGHELSHVTTRQAGTPLTEQQADVLGAQLAMRAGYSLRRYIQFLYGLNSCSKTHGCWHTRARNLEQRFRVNVGLWRNNHAGHRTPTSWFVQTRGPARQQRGAKRPR